MTHLSLLGSSIGGLHSRKSSGESKVKDGCPAHSTYSIKATRLDLVLSVCGLLAPGSRNLHKTQRIPENSPEIAKPRSKSWESWALAGLVLAQLQNHYPLGLLFLSLKGPGSQSLRPSCDCWYYPGLTLICFSPLQ